MRNTVALQGAPSDRDQIKWVDTIFIIEGSFLKLVNPVDQTFPRIRLNSSLIISDLN